MARSSEHEASKEAPPPSKNEFAEAAEILKDISKSGLLVLPDLELPELDLTIP